MAQSLAGAIALLAAGGLRLPLPKSLAIGPNSTALRNNVGKHDFYRYPRMPIKGLYSGCFVV
jgi:hypothetical protein